MSKLVFITLILAGFTASTLANPQLQKAAWPDNNKIAVSLALKLKPLVMIL